MDRDIDYNNTFDVVQKLNEIYPNEMPKSLIGEIELARKMGQQDVLRYITSLLVYQEHSNQG